jgi:hypothetical protein
MQIKQGTFDEVADKGWDINNPEHNARAGVRYLKKMADLADGDPKLAAVGYYGGPGAIEKAKKGIAVSDPRNPNAPNTLQYGDQVASRVGGGDKWWADAPVEGAEAPQAVPKAAPPVQASAPQVATGSVTKQGAKPSPQGPQEAPKEQPSFLKTADDTIRHIADTATFGLADKFAAKMDELTGRTQGTTYEENLKKERKQDEDASTGAKVAGTVIGSLIPGLGVLKAAQAPATASRLARAGYGAASGAAMGAASGVGHNDEDSLVSKGMDALKGGAVGGVVGGVIPAVLPATMEQKVASFIKKHGSDEQARRIAEGSQDLTGLATREAQGAKALGAKNRNGLAEKYIQDASKYIKDPEARTALQEGRNLSDAQLAELPENIREVVNKHTALMAATAPTPARNGIVSKALRAAVDSGALGEIPIPGASVLFNNRPTREFILNRVLGGRETTEAAIQNLVKQAPVADKVLEKLGPSKGAQALQKLQAQSQAAKRAADTDTAQKIADVAAKAQQQAKVKITMAKATRMPQGGGFQTLLAGGDSGLNLPSKVAIQDLRTLSNHPVLGKLADELRRTGAIKDNEAGFYGLTNALRKMQEGRQAAWRAKNPKGNP